MVSFASSGAVVGIGLNEVGVGEKNESFCANKIEDKGIEGLFM